MPLPAAPPPLNAQSILLESYGISTDRTVRSRSFAALVTNATGYKLKIYEIDGTLFWTSAEVPASTYVIAPHLQPNNYRGYLQWFSVNAEGETGGQIFGFDVNPTNYPTVGFFPPCPSVPTFLALPDEPAQVTVQSILSGNAAMCDVGYAEEKSGENNNASWGDYQRLHVKNTPDFPGSPSDSETGEALVDSNTLDLLSPARMVWILGNTHGQSWGPSAAHQFGFAVNELTLLGSVFVGGRWHTNDNTPTFEWNVSGGPQTQKRLLVRHNIVGGATVYDSGFEASGDENATCLTNLDDGDYLAQVTVKRANGDTTNPAQLTFIVGEEGGGGGTDYYCPPGWTFSLELGRCVLCGSATSDVPSVPDAPVVAKDCIAPAIVVTPPSWDEAEEHPTQTMELQRRANSGEGFGDWETIHVWDSPGGIYEDVDVQWFSLYQYRVRGCNEAGCSAWSGITPVTLQSSSLTITWLSPVSGAVLSAHQDFRFQLIDESEPGECEVPVGCSNDDPNIALFIDGMETEIVLVRESGTPRNGIYRVKGFDTRDFAQGARLLTLIGTGVDCCRARVSRPFTFNNTLRRGTLYFPYQWDFAPPAGQDYGKAQILMQNEALYDHPARRYWVRMGLTAQPEAMILWDSLLLSPAQKAEAFDELQPFAPETYQHGTTPERTQIGGYVPVLTPGQALYLVQQWNPTEVLTTYLTGMSIGAVRSIRPYSDGVYHIFASKNDGTDAKLFSFDYESGLSLLVDLAVHDAANALDCVRINDKYFVVRPEEIFTIDADAGEIAMPSDPRGEARPGRFVLKTSGAGGDDDNQIALGIYVDADVPEEQTAAYDLTYRSPKLLWDFDEIVSIAQFTAGRLMIVSGPKLYSTTNISQAPTLLHTFAANIVSLGLSDETWIVGLANNHVWALVEGTWIDRGALATPPLSLSGWEGTGETFYDVAGGDSAQLFERVLAGGDGDVLWSDLRTIEAQEADVTTITALARYEKVIRPASGTPGEPNFQPEEKMIGLLIGTGPDGVLLLLELSPFTSQNALLASKMSHFGLDGFEVPIS